MTGLIDKNVSLVMVPLLLMVRAPDTVEMLFTFIVPEVLVIKRVPFSLEMVLTLTGMFPFVTLIVMVTESLSDPIISSVLSSVSSALVKLKFISTACNFA